MTRKEIAQLACKVLALFLFYQTAVSLYGIVLLFIVAIPNMNSGRWEDVSSASIFIGVQGLGTFLLGVLLWWQSGRIASRMVSSDPAPVTSGSLNQRTILSLAVSAVGVLITVGVLPRIAKWVYLVLRGRHLLAGFSEDVQWQASLVTDVVELLLGIWLIFGSRGIARMVRRYRSAGFSRSPGNPP